MVRHDLLSFRAVLFLLGLTFGAIHTAGAQQEARKAPSNGKSQPGVYLVFPFENEGASARLDWLSEGLEELTIQYLNGAGQGVYSHSARTAELERNGLPFSAKLSRASMLRIAEDLDADFVIFGSFKSDGTSLTVQARVLRLDPATLLPPVSETGPLASLMELQTRVVWRLVGANDHSYQRTLADFAKMQRPLRLDAFEHYIRGLLATEDEARLRELREASRLEPGWADVDFALGQTYQARNDCNSALAWLARVPKNHERYVEAVFSTGVCYLQLNQPGRAEEVFTALQNAVSANANPAQSGLASAELPEILNNLGIARARQDKKAAAEEDFRRASDLDPDEDDYPFNLGLLAFRSKNFASAANYFREASERRPDNPEDRAFLVQSLERADKKAEADEERQTANAALGSNTLPVLRLDSKNELPPHLERIKMELDTTALRFEMEGPSAETSAAVENGAMETAASHIRRGRQELAAGRLDAAEGEFRSVLKSDQTSPAAHRGLGEIARRRGKLDDAVKEFQASLAVRDSAVLRITLARVYLEQKKPDLARTEVERSLKLAPNYAEAKQLLEHLQNSKPNGGAQ